MIQPKELYRKLAALLANIENGKSKDHFLFSVLRKMNNSFTRDLHIVNGRLFVESRGQFLLAEFPDSQDPADLKISVALDSETVHRVIKNGSYIFNNPEMVTELQVDVETESDIRAAFVVHNPEKRWIFMFVLTKGWVREEVEFYLNAIRAQLNFQLHSEAMKNEMQQAAIIQQSLLPNSPPNITGYEIAGRSYQAEVVGGDFFDFSIFSDDIFSVAVGDASGHGLPAALLVRDVVTGLRMGVEKEVKMTKAMEKLNRILQRSTLSSRFVSLFYGAIERNGNFYYVNAGHPPPLLISGSQIKQLNATGTILGAVPEISLKQAFACFQPGGVLVMYSDGLLERYNNLGEEFGLPRLENLVMKYQHKSAQKILELIHETVFAFGKQAKWQDDVTVVIVKKI
jgi:sigma-B regulation protein RsbU (phosphoserine phosphatase)